jgi:hypothetical protein
MKKRIRLLAFTLFILTVGLLSVMVVSYAQDSLAPDGTPGETYYAPFPLTMTLDGDFSDWAGVPRVTMPEPTEGIEPNPDSPAITFAGAADDTYIYLMGEVIDGNIISGEHGENYWNEDSVEFYLNGTGDLSQTRYVDGVTQITIPPMNIGVPPEDVILSGIQGNTVGAQVVVVKTDTGYAIEMAVPLENEVWRMASRCM